MRLMFFIVSIVNCNYILFHYGVISAHYRPLVYFIVDFFRYISLSFVCYYYSTKATGLIPKQSQKLIVTILKVVMGLSVPVYLTIILYQTFDLIGEDPDTIEKQLKTCILPIFIWTR